MYFNGVRSVGMVNFDPALAPADALTFEAWIRPERIDVMQHIAGVGNGGWAVSLLCGSGGPRDSTTGCCGTHENGRVGFFTKGSQIDPDTACSQQPASNVSVNEYEWNHIAVTVENDTIVSFYINGALSGEFTSPSERIRILDAGGSGNLTLGAYFGGDEMPCPDGSRRCSFYAGEMDEVKFWHARLAAETISFHKDYSYVHWHPNAGNLIAYYKFDQARGRYAYEYFHTKEYVMDLYSSDDDHILWNNGTTKDAPLLGTPSPPMSPTPPNPPPPSPPAFPPAPPKARGKYEPRVDEGNTAVYFDGAKSFGRIGNDASLLSTANSQTMTIEAWIKPESGDEFARLQTIAMLGDLGWGVQLMCPEGAGLGCCGDHVMRSVGFFAQEHPLPSDACERTLSSTVGVALDEWSHIAIVVDPEGHTTPIPPPPSPPSPLSPLSPSSPPLFPPPAPVPCQRQIVVTRTDADWWGKDLKFNCASGDGSRNITVNVGASAYASTHVYPVGEIVPDDCPVAVDKDNCAPHCDLFTPQGSHQPTWNATFSVSVGECVPLSGCTREVHVTALASGGDFNGTLDRPSAWDVDLHFQCGDDDVHVGNSTANPKVVQASISNASSCPSLLDGSSGKGNYTGTDRFFVDVKNCTDSGNARRRTLLEASTPISSAAEDAATASRSLSTTLGATRRAPRRRLSQSSCDPTQGDCGCNATAPVNGTLGNCAQQLNHSDTCVPECVADYALVGNSSCYNGTFESARCVYDGEYKTADVFCPAWQNMIKCSLAGDDETACTGEMFNQTCDWRDEEKECVSKVAAEVATYTEAIQKSQYVLSQHSSCQKHANGTTCASDDDCYWYEDDDKCGYSRQFANATLTANMSTLNPVTLAFEGLERLDQICSGLNETECPERDECRSAIAVEPTVDGLSRDIFGGCEPSVTYYLSEARAACAGQGATFTSYEETMTKIRSAPRVPPRR